MWLGGDQMTVLGSGIAGCKDRSGDTLNERHHARSFRFRRKALTTLSACILVVTLSGAAAQARPATKSGLSGTLTMNVFTFTTPVMKPVIAAFEKANPG